MIMRIKSWHKNHALLMASHLPTDVEDARIVLELLRDIFELFVAEPEPEHGTECANVVTLVKGVFRHGIRTPYSG
jgi:hypothetical protein